MVSPQFQDDRNAVLREAVVHNIGRGARYCYFVPKLDLEDGRPFWLFLHRLAQDHTTLRNRLQKQIHGIGLEEAELRWLLIDLIIANPLDPATRAGFIGLRNDRTMKFASGMSSLDVEGSCPFLPSTLR